MAAKKVSKKTAKVATETETDAPEEGTITADFAYSKDTKNKYRYDEIDEGDGVAVGSLYVVKSYLGDEPPEKLTITIREG